MLVPVPTREDVLAIRFVEDAFDLTTTKPQRGEVALIRVALAEDLIDSTMHQLEAGDDEFIPDVAVDRAIARSKPVSKDVDRWEPRQVGIDFEGDVRGSRRIRVKVSWDETYYIATVHTV